MRAIILTDDPSDVISIGENMFNATAEKDLSPEMQEKINELLKLAEYKTNE